MKTGVLLVNLGTPDAPDVPAVRRYLAEFLMDPRVIDTGWLSRALLVYGGILPFRPARSASQYRQIWTDRGSPLLRNGLDLRDALAARLGPDIEVRFGMRYANPPLTDALAAFEREAFQRVVVVPLYPQYASSSTGSSLDLVYRWAQDRAVPPNLTIVPPFHAHAGFLEALAAVTRETLDAEQPDHLLMSFHGLPERQVKATDRTGRHCLASADCCATLGPANQDCYRAQSYATARALAQRLGLSQDGWSVSFQSRLGRTPWIEPHTDVVLPGLAKRYRKLAVVCPSFVADCLETLEEIGFRAKAQFLAAGGKALVPVPCVNAHPLWVEGLAKIVGELLPS